MNKNLDKNLVSMFAREVSYKTVELYLQDSNTNARLGGLLYIRREQNYLKEIMRRRRFVEKVARRFSWDLETSYQICCAKVYNNLEGEIDARRDLYSCLFSR